MLIFGQVRRGRCWALLRRVLCAGVIRWAGDMGGGVLTDDIPVEITKINARPAPTPGCTTAAASTVWDLIAFVVDVEIRGTVIRCCSRGRRAKRYGPTRGMAFCLLVEINRRGRI